MILSDSELHRLYRYALSLTGDKDEAYDLLQTAVLRFLESDTKKIGKPMAYVSRIIRNHYFDAQRRANVIDWQPFPDDEPIDLSLTPIEQAMVDFDEVAWLLSVLSDRERELLFLWAVEGYTMEEISAHTDTPRATLLSRLHRIRQRLVERRRVQGGLA